MFYNKAFYRIITERKEDYQIEKILDSYFDSAAMAYDNEAKKIFKQYAVLNFPF